MIDKDLFFLYKRLQALPEDILQMIMARLPFDYAHAISSGIKSPVSPFRYHDPGDSITALELVIKWNSFKNLDSLLWNPNVDPSGQSLSPQKKDLQRL